MYLQPLLAVLSVDDSAILPMASSGNTGLILTPESFSQWDYGESHDKQPFHSNSTY
jgi:hypothetical protein